MCISVVTSTCVVNSFCVGCTHVKRNLHFHLILSINSISCSSSFCASLPLLVPVTSHAHTHTVTISWLPVLFCALVPVIHYTLASLVPSNSLEIPALTYIPLSKYSGCALQSVCCLLRALCDPLVCVFLTIVSPCSFLLVSLFSSFSPDLPHSHVSLLSCPLDTSPALSTLFYPPLDLPLTSSCHDSTAGTYIKRSPYTGS